MATPRPRGRPRPDVAPLSRERILSAAMHTMASGATDVGMRAVATALGVNAMALYHYFKDKQALRDALVEQAFAPLYTLQRRLGQLPAGEPRLRLLANTYLRCAVNAQPLTRYLAVRGGTPLAAVFEGLWDMALGGASPRSASAAAARNVLVDYLHGLALAGPRPASRALHAGWPVLMEGVRAHLPHNRLAKEGPP